MPPTIQHSSTADSDRTQVPAPAYVPNTYQPDESCNPFNPPPKLSHLNLPIFTPSLPREEARLKRTLGQPPLFSPNTRSSLQSAGSSFGRKQRQSTPYSDKISEALKPNPKRDEHKKLVKLELGTFIGLKDEGAWAKSLYTHLVSNASIDEFFAESGLYNARTRRWSTIPESTSDLEEGDLYKPFVDISNAILRKFVLTESEEGELLREAIDTHDTNIPHHEEVKTTLVSRPDVSIRGQGSSFQVPEANREGTAPKVGFSNMSSFEEMKVEKSNVSATAQGLQVAVYVRQIFIHQPNRRYVRVLILTETNLRLFHFDRSGGLYTPYINIHQDPYTFIRLVVGLNSLDESVLGFDMSIQWRIEGGRKIDGTLKTRREDDTTIIYNLSKVDPIITFFDISGRGTQWWSVSDPITGDQLLIKDCWKAEDRVSEYKHLKKTRGLPGVAQMLSFERNRGKTEDFRPSDSTAHKEFHNRVAARIVINSYGDSIESFKSPKDLLCALRDAINGHMNLYLKKRLHRDVTIDNILLGKKADGSNPDPGYRGFLIDLYMAIKIGRDMNKLSSERRTGSRRYLSIAVLLCCKDSIKNPFTTIAHDHLDDLESFFYVYSYIIHVYDSSGASYDIPELFIDWEQCAASKTVESKYTFLRRKLLKSKEIEERWPQQCINVFQGFRKFLLPHAEKKMDIINDDSANNETEIKYLMTDIVKHYETVLHLFNNAIDSLEDEGASAFETVQGGSAKGFSTSAANYDPDRNGLKRELEDEYYMHELPQAKRGRGSEANSPERRYEVLPPRKSSKLVTPQRGARHFHGPSPLRSKL
ncbi:hypothetical protein H1R20_g15067, partial [Candolleomyces eurysporus]